MLKRQVNSMDLIERQAAIDAIKELCQHYTPTKSVDHPHMNFVIEELENLPSVQPERKKGKWIPQDHNKKNGMISTTVYYYPKCSECGFAANYTSFCPSCGADMRGETDV